ncbi:MAG: hypothetical protein R3C14_34525 [Caldilineaceae bacterium]
MSQCDICGAPLKKAPFSSTLFQNRYICEGAQRHAFAKETTTGILVRVAPATTSLIVGAVMVTKALALLSDFDG